MAYPTTEEILQAVDNLIWKDGEEKALRRSQGFWHTFIFLRHCSINGAAERKYNFTKTSDFVQACFDVNGIYLPIDSSSRSVYFEPCATQGNTPSSYFRNQQGPRQTYLNRIYTGLVGEGPRQPNLFKGSSKTLPVIVELNENWIQVLRGYDENREILDVYLREFLIYLFRFGTPLPPYTGAIGEFDATGKVLNQVVNPNFTELPNTHDGLRDAILGFLGITRDEFDELFPKFEDLSFPIVTGDKPTDFEKLRAEMLNRFSVSDKPSNTAQVVLNDDDPILEQVLNLIERRNPAGIVFTGPPGTSKTWYARNIARVLVDGDESRIVTVQFHQSYSYEDFVEGYIPHISDFSSTPQFKLESKVFLKLCEAARENDSLHVLIIDEFSRGDPSRIFGEILTYIEKDYRGEEFTLPYSGRITKVPSNILILATMNPYDRSVADIDDAMERRFDWVSMPPSTTLLSAFLRNAGMEGELLGRVITFFNYLNRKNICPHGIGHALFIGCETERDLVFLWNHKLKFVLERMFRFEDGKYESVYEEFKKILTDNTDVVR